ncbi:hypothetical protein ACFL1H_03820 [Nanoarchaeota archaeon]
MTKPIQLKDIIKPMTIGIIGPTQIDKFCKIINMDKQEYINKIKRLAKALVNTEIILVTNKGSSCELFAQEYKKNKGKKLKVLVPQNDKEFGIDYLNTEIADEIVNCGTWRNQPEELCEQSTQFICLGLSQGTMIEVLFTKWFKVDAIYMFNELQSKELPEELIKDLNIFQSNFEDFMKIFESQENKLFESTDSSLIFKDKKLGQAFLNLGKK